MDQAKSQNQGFCGAQCQCREVADLGCCDHLFLSCHRQKRLHVSASLHSMLQVISLHLFESTPLRDLFEGIGSTTLKSLTSLSSVYLWKSPDSSGSDRNYLSGWCNCTSNASCMAAIGGQKATNKRF